MKLVPTTLKTLLATLALAAAGVQAQTPIDTAGSIVNDKAPLTYALSRDHVNLVRVVDDRITDAVFDAEALDVSADKVRGIVFVRVKKKWLANAGSDVTSAFFNTETQNHAVRFVVSSVPSQTIDLIRTTTKDTAKAADAVNDKALEVPLARFSQSDYVSELKEIVKTALTGKRVEAGAVLGRAFSQDASLVQELEVPVEVVRSQGLVMKTVRAFVTADKLCEVIEVKNMTGVIKKLDAAALTKNVAGVLAVSLETDTLAVAQTTQIAVIRDRMFAVIQSESGVRLTLDFLK